VFQHEACQDPSSVLGHLHADAAAVVGVALPADETRTRAPVDQADGALMPDLQPFRQIGHRGTRIGEVFDEEEQLVLAGGHSRFPRGILREPKKPAQRVSEPGEIAVVLALEVRFPLRAGPAAVRHDRKYIVLRYLFPRVIASSEGKENEMSKFHPLLPRAASLLAAAVFVSLTA
jgi:hypothetical protein